MFDARQAHCQDSFLSSNSDIQYTYLVEVDRGLPELLVGLVEVPHTDLTEVTGVVLVEVGSVVVLTTGHTTTTGVLTVFADTTVASGHVAAPRDEFTSVMFLS